LSSLAFAFGSGELTEQEAEAQPIRQADINVERIVVVTKILRIGGVSIGLCGLEV